VSEEYVALFSLPFLANQLYFQGGWQSSTDWLDREGSSIVQLRDAAYESIAQ
jgi:hypothetical protein